MQDLIDYYNCSTKRDWAGRPLSFQGTASIADGMAPTLHNSAPQVALFSSRGPGIKDFSFQDADVLKPDILAPGSLIWAAWTPNGTDEANYLGKNFFCPYPSHLFPPVDHEQCNQKITKLLYNDLHLSINYASFLMSPHCLCCS